jgi:hypothetical protein
VELKNMRTTDLQFNLLPSKDMLHKTECVTLKAREQNISDIAPLGDTANAYLMFSIQIRL